MTPTPSALHSSQNATNESTQESNYLLEDSTEKVVGPGDDTVNGYASNGHTFQAYTRQLSNAVRFADSSLLSNSSSSLIRRAANGLIPSFIQARMRGETAQQEKLYPTSHLDGLRGVAAFFVFMGHMSYVCFPILVGYASGQPGEYMNILMLPIIRLMYSGAAAVAVFFVISGYALSVKPLKLIRSRSYDDLFTTISSATFRRGFRLFLPCAISTFLILILIQMGLYEITRDIAYDKSLLRSFQESHKIQRPTLIRQVQDWYTGMSRFIWVWNFSEVYGGSIDYDLHLWTIPVEFRASLVLFLTQIGLAKMRVRARFCITLLLIWFATRWGRWEMCLFWSGFMLAEYDLIQAAKVSKLQGSATPSTHRNGQIWHFIYIFCFICALYFLSYPEQGAESMPGYGFLEHMVPHAIKIEEPFRFWTSIGAIMLIWSTNSLKYLANLFNHSVIQYLGKISYALYLMHGPVIHTWGYFCMMVFWKIFGSDTEFGYNLGFILSACCIIPAVIWAADVFWRAVDIPVVKFARWLENKLVIDS